MFYSQGDGVNTSLSRRMYCTHQCCSLVVPFLSCVLCGYLPWHGCVLPGTKVGNVWKPTIPAGISRTPSPETISHVTRVPDYKPYCCRTDAETNVARTSLSCSPLYGNSIRRWFAEPLGSNHPLVHYRSGRWKHKTCGRCDHHVYPILCDKTEWHEDTSVSKVWRRISQLNLVSPQRQ